MYLILTVRLHRKLTVQIVDKNITEFVEREQMRGMIGILEYIGTGLVDRHGARAGGRIRYLTRMQHLGVEAEIKFLGHGGAPLVYPAPGAAGVRIN